MRLVVVAVGKVRDRHLRALCDDFVERTRRMAPLAVVEVRDGKGDVGREATALLKQMPPGVRCVELSDRGTSRSSEDLARWLSALADGGCRELRFVIGGPYGLDPSVSERCRDSLALSSMTLTHEMARLLLLEQVYRAHAIQRGLPYHHG